MIKFIHTADIHFGMENYGKIDPETGIHSRLLDFKRALDHCIDTAIAENVDFFLFAGDAYKTAHPSPTQQRLLLRCFLRLYQAQIPVVIVVGNHDNPLSFGKATSLDLFSDLPVDGFHVITKPTVLNLTTRQGIVQIVGIPWPTRNTISINKEHVLTSAHEITTYIARAVAHIIKELAAQLDPTLPAILTAHLTVSNGIFSGSEKRAIYGTDPLLLPSQLALAPFDYVALGHLHRYQNVNPDGYPAVVYSGSIERIDFGERKEDKGFCLVTFEKKGSTHHTFISVPTRPFIQVDVHLTPDSTTHTQQILDALKNHTLEHAVIKIVYHVPPATVDKVHLATIQKACMAAHYLVGIIPIRPLEIRERRNTLHVDKEPCSLLEAYFAARPEYKQRQQELITKTKLLLQELDQATDEESNL